MCLRLLFNSEGSPRVSEVSPRISEVSPRISGGFSED